MIRSVTAFLLALSLASTASTAFGGLRPLLPGEKIVYQTVQSGADYRTFPNLVSQITGSGLTEYGDEVLLDTTSGPGAAGTAQFITNIAIGTQTFDNAATPAYMDGVNTSGGADPVDVGGFLELSIYINDGPADAGGSGSAVEATPDGQLQPGTLIGRSRVPTPTYPTGGTDRGSNGAQDPNNPNDNGADPFIVEFPFPFVAIPANKIISFALINLNRFGVPDGHNSDGNQFGVWHANGSVAAGPLAQPGAGGPYYYGDPYNTNVVGNSRTGPNINRFNNNGQWTWIEYLGSWESTRNVNNIVEATIYAALEVPEPSSFCLAGIALAGLGLGAVRRRRSA